MRKAYNDSGFLIWEDTFCGISLGYDFAAEHEWGIAGLKRYFGIDTELNKDNLGIRRRMVTEVPKHGLKFQTFKRKPKGSKKMVNYAALTFEYPFYIDKDDDKLPNDLQNFKDELEWRKDPLITAWDEKSFGIVVKGQTEVVYLEELYNQLKEKNVAITSLNFAGDNPFANSSLSLVIKDRLPKKMIEDAYVADKEVFDLELYCKKIGMTKLIKKQGNKNGYKDENYFCACSPHWISYRDEEYRNNKKKEYNTTFDVWYWVNYSDNDNTHGWYSVEEIKKWLSTDGLKLSQIRNQVGKA